MTTDELLAKMDTLLHFGGEWHARAKGKNTFGHAVTARDAMLAALGMPVDNLPNADLF